MYRNINIEIIAFLLTYMKNPVILQNIWYVPNQIFYRIPSVQIRLFNIFRKSYPEFLSPEGSFTSVYISLLYYSSKKKLWEKFKI